MIRTRKIFTRIFKTACPWPGLLLLPFVATPGCGIYGSDTGPEVEGGATIRFDGGEGAGNGATTFSFMGANFSGGTIRTLGDPQLYGSGLFAYEVLPSSTVNVTFDAPIDLLQLFFAKRGTGSTLLTAYDADDIVVGTATALSSSAATGGSMNVALSAPATRIDVIHTGGGDGWIDNFTFRNAP
jgi:hypothetical protein